MKKVIRSDNSDARNINQGLMSKLFRKHPSPLKSFFSHSVMKLFPSLSFLGLVFSVAFPNLLTTRSLHNSIKNDLKSLWSDIFLLCLFTSDHFVLQLTHLGLLWTHFLFIYLFLRAPILSRVSFLCVESKIRFTNKPQSSLCFFNSQMRRIC